MKKKIYLIALIIFLISLVGCSKKESIIGTFGYNEESIKESINSAENSDMYETTELDKFKIDAEINKSPEEKSIERAEKYQSIDNLGNMVDSRDEINYYGLLNYIKSLGGIESVSKTYNRDVFAEDLNKFELVTVEEKEAVLEAIYNENSEERELLIRDLLHTEEGWVFTEEGWKNVYEETNGLNISVID